MSGSSFPSQTKPIRQLPISINLRIVGVGSLPRTVRRSQDDEGGRGRRTQPGVLTPGKIQSNARPERALDVRVGYRVYCEPRNSYRKMTFEEEFRTLLQKPGMPFNERSAWD